MLFFSKSNEKNLKSPSSPVTKESSDQPFAKTAAPDLISPGLVAKVQQGIRNDLESKTAQDPPSNKFKPSSVVEQQLNKPASEQSSQPSRFDKSLTLTNLKIDPSRQQALSLNTANPPGSPTGSVKSLSSAISNLIASKVPNSSSSSRGPQPLKPAQAPSQPQIHVPQFYFPHGKPEDKQFKTSSDLDAMRQVNAEFRNHKDGKLFKEDFSDLLKILGKQLDCPAWNGKKKIF